MTGAFILDCSVTMAWFFESEAAAATDDVLDDLNAGAQAVVPVHWVLEVGNTLLTGERHKRCSAAESTHFIGLLAALPIETDTETAANASATALGLARSHALTLYDAVYLELAVRRALPLATLDRNLRTAARKSGLSVLPDRL